jgi:hypothetical protein
LVHEALGQALLHVPQCAAFVASATSHPLPALPSQSAKPTAQSRPQRVPSQLGVALAPPGHALHDAPQVAGSVLRAHPAPHLWKPASQTMPHVPEVQVASELGCVGHGEHDAPQCAGSWLRTHAPLHA